MKYFGNIVSIGELAENCAKQIAAKSQVANYHAVTNEDAPWVDITYVYDPTLFEAECFTRKVGYGYTRIVVIGNCRTQAEIKCLFDTVHLLEKLP